MENEINFFIIQINVSTNCLRKEKIYFLSTTNRLNRARNSFSSAQCNRIIDLNLKRKERNRKENTINLANILTHIKYKKKCTHTKVKLSIGWTWSREQAAQPGRIN